ncbi:MULTISPECIES: hypothetical protein [unclassified Crossiella]|uniref:hypothetical protein n=1 Tax=unclassified Crossiella TaxID=2620835 RepID=UPI00207CC909|nr:MULTISPECIES: hypothetical protein [unclassified Crossiella]MCO1581885.1 hypothetical protein [Crossiella sp. SN42]WHT16107.1 hypothetical protein N8J89_23550 [Crossiella sp. CA-258035]
MTSSDKVAVNIPALKSYAKQLDYYQSEADKFGRLVDAADVTNEAWGVMGAFAKSAYTERLGDLRELMAAMKEGVETLSGKILDTAAIYEGAENDAVIEFGRHKANIDGPRGGKTK